METTLNAFSLRDGPTFMKEERERVREILQTTLSLSLQLDRDGSRSISQDTGCCRFLLPGWFCSPLDPLSIKG